MRLSWADQAPPGITFQGEEEVLTNLEQLAVAARFEVVPLATLDQELRAGADLVIQTPQGKLIFGVRRKAANGRNKIDIDTRPERTYRTRHLLLRQIGDEPWELINDSDLRDGDVPANADELRFLVDRLFAIQ
jgi:hypothetical protein